MNLTSAALVAYMLLDFMQPLSSGVPAAPNDTAYSVSGSGELRVVMDTAQSIGSVPRGASRIPFLTVDLSASCDSDVRVDSLELTHAGLGSSDDIARIYAVDAFRRITRAASFDHGSRKAVLRFRSLRVPACGAVQFQILGDMRRDAIVASEHGVDVSGPLAVTSSAKKVVFVQSDDTRRVVSAPTVAGSVTVRFLPIGSRLQSGRRETVARLQISADNVAAHLLQKITFRNRGSARDMDLQWLSLETLSGTVLTPPVSRMRGIDSTLAFDPTYVIHAGQTIVLQLKADVHGSQSKTVDFFIEEPSDVVVMPYRDR